MQNVSFYVKANKPYPISGFRRKADETCAILGYYAASGGTFLPAFRGNLSVASSRVKSPGVLKHQ